MASHEIDEDWWTSGRHSWQRVIDNIHIILEIMADRAALAAITPFQSRRTMDAISSSDVNPRYGTAPECRATCISRQLM